MGWIGVATVVGSDDPLDLRPGRGPYPSAMAGALQPFPQIAGAASALMGFVQMGSSALGSLAVARLNDGTALAIGVVPVAMGLLGFAVYWLTVGRPGALPAVTAAAARAEAEVCGDD